MKNDDTKSLARSFIHSLIIIIIIIHKLNEMEWNLNSIPIASTHQIGDKLANTMENSIGWRSIDGDRKRSDFNSIQFIDSN